MGNVNEDVSILFSWVPLGYLLLVVCFLAGYALSASTVLFFQTSAATSAGRAVQNIRRVFIEVSGGAVMASYKRTKHCALSNMAAIN